jgi:hypothetical protein
MGDYDSNSKNHRKLKEKAKEMKKELPKSLLPERSKSDCDSIQEDIKKVLSDSQEELPPLTAEELKNALMYMPKDNTAIMVHIDPSRGIGSKLFIAKSKKGTVGGQEQTHSDE